MSSAFSQVTIGSGIKPRKGTLLDLKQNANSGDLANSTKALGLPKIALEELDELQIAKDVFGLDYEGIIVSNKTVNTDFGLGIYAWDGIDWNELVSSKSKGKNRQVLTLFADNKSDWADIPIQTYNYYKPTTSSYYVKEKSEPKTYNYADIVKNPVSGSNTYEAKPAAGLFDNKYIYSTTFSTDNTNREKLVEVAFSIQISLATVGGVLFLNQSVWHQYQFWIIIDGQKRHSLIQSYNSIYHPVLSNNQYHKFLLPKEFAVGEHTLNIQIELLSSCIKRNVGSAPGSFDPNETDFLKAEILNCNMLMYED